MSSIMKIKNIKFRDALVNHNEGETVYCEEEDKAFMWHNDMWLDVPGDVNEKGHFQINYRELMINTIKDFEPLNETQLENVKKLTHDFVWKSPTAHYYALIAFPGGNVIDFTLFVPKTKGEEIGVAIIDILQARGEFIYMEDVDPDEDIQITYWVRAADGTLKDYYLANYDGGVIEYA